MRIYSDETRTELVAVVCNSCSKELLVENGILKEECVPVEHSFGFFGLRDGECDRFDLCEECYQKMISRFRIPVEKWDRKELL